MSKKFKNTCHYLAVLLVIICSTVAARPFDYLQDYLQDYFPYYPPIPQAGNFAVTSASCTMVLPTPPSPASITWGGIPIGYGVPSSIFQCSGSYQLQYISGINAGTNCKGIFSDDDAGMETNRTGLLNPGSLSYNFILNNMLNNCTSSAFLDPTTQPIIDVFMTCSLIGGIGGSMNTRSVGYPMSCTPTGTSSFVYVLNFDNSSIVKYALSDLAVSGSPAPRVTISGAATTLANPCYGAFASDGSLWLGNSGNNTVLQFTAAQLAASGSPVPNTTLSTAGGQMNQPCGVVFDSGGGIWVSNFNTTQIVHFTAAQIAAGGSQTPDKILTNNGTSIDFSEGLQFDASGNLWVASFSGNQLSKFSPAQLAVAGTSSPVPVVAFTSDGVDSPQQPQAVIFDTSGNLWTSNNICPGASCNISKYSASRLSTGGNTAPDLVINYDTTRPDGLVFDPSGNLWDADYGANQLLQFSASQLATSGTVTLTPVVIINVPGTGPSGILIHNQ